MNRIAVFLFLFVVFSVTESFCQIRTQQIVRTDTLTRRDTVITTEVVRRTEIINRTEEVILIDTIYSSDGSKRVVKRDGLAALPAIEVIPAPESTPPESLPEDSSLFDKPFIPEVTEELPFISEPESTECSLPPVFPSASDSLSVSKKGGKYMWIPDAMTEDIERFLSGEANITEDYSVISRDEKVLFRGDTVPMVLRDRNLGRYNRGLFNYLYVPKGIWQFGITASYGELSTEDLEVFDLLSDVDIHGKIFSVRPYFSYFINNNMAVGMRLGYSYGRADVESFNVDIDDDMSFNLHDIMYRSEKFTAAFTFTQYFGMARRGRFAIFNEVELAFSGGNSDFIRPYNGELKPTHTTTMQAALNFSPGLSVFIIDPVTFNISFGVFGFSLKNEKQTVDGEELGSRFTSGANFRFNIFNINFGIAVNL
ncbi:MAG: autotransporter outer membrane beta-barrel domain-containing protein [Bacteroides sp.]|nr:autotransporter outer membrane beta-barrel domain-containing protein [Bacteroides sp.]